MEFLTQSCVFFSSLNLKEFCTTERLDKDSRSKLDSSTTNTIKWVNAVGMHEFVNHNLLNHNPTTIRLITQAYTTSTSTSNAFPTQISIQTCFQPLSHLWLISVFWRTQSLWPPTYRSTKKSEPQKEEEEEADWFWGYISVYRAWKVTTSFQRYLLAVLSVVPILNWRTRKLLDPQLWMMWFTKWSSLWLADCNG